MFYVNFGYGFSTKEYKSLGGAKRAASCYLKKMPVGYGVSSVIIGERQNGKMESIIRVYRWGCEDIR